MHIQGVKHVAIKKTFCKKLALTICITSSMLCDAEPKRFVPQPGYIRDYTLLCIGWRAMNYICGNHNRREDIYAAVKKDDVEAFKKIFIREDLVGNPEILIAVIEENSMKIVRFLVEEKNLDIKTIHDNVAKKDSSRRTPILYTLLENHNLQAVEMTSYLKKLGFDINARNDKGETLIHRAAALNDPEMVQKLITAGVDVNKQNNKGNTACHEIILGEKSLKSFALLLDASDTNLELTNNDNLSVIEIMRDQEFDACILLPKDPNRTTLQESVRQCGYYTGLRNTLRKSLRANYAQEIERGLASKREAIEDQAARERRLVEERRMQLAREEEELRRKQEQEKLVLAQEEKKIDQNKEEQQQALGQAVEIIDLLRQDASGNSNTNVSRADLLNKERYTQQQ